MLVLTRKLNHGPEEQEIILETKSGPIKIVLVEINSLTRARIGIEAPKDVKIWRSELLTQETT